ncbi:MAG: DUF937 domain-containing protein [Luteimonas sp.]
MAGTLSSDLLSRLAGAPAEQIAQRLGITPSQASTAIGAALPLLLGALGRNASQPQGAESLFGALKEHRERDIGGVLDAAMQGEAQGPQILGHMFGARQPRAEQAVGQATGIGRDKAGMLLRWLAPIAMAYLAKRMFSMRHPPQAATSQADGAGAATGTATPSPQVLGEVLHHETQQASRQHGGLLGAVLDRDGDGDVDFSDLLKAGGSILGAGTGASRSV